MRGEIDIVELGKAYRQYDAPRDRLVEWLSLGRFQRHRTHWALRGITLRVRKGESVGILGANGAGKSTLLKLITGTTRPTTGVLNVDGRTAALLELGIGFHPEITGRENALMAGQLLGYRVAEIADRMPEIESFAEIGEYICAPLRTYSSGMQARLAFSVATAIRPDILIVDEALSVGDAYFQHKSFARIREFRAEGTTLLFVSHSAPVVKSLCDRAILLEDGLMVRDGQPDQVVDYYHALVAARSAQYQITEIQGGGTRSGDRRALIEEIALVSNGTSASVVRSGQATAIRVHLRALQDLDDLTVGFLIRDTLGNDVYGTNTYHLQHRKFNVPAGTLFLCEFEFGKFALGVGHFNVCIALHSDMTHVSGNYDWWDRAMNFEVLPGNAVHGIGVAALEVTCRMQPLSSDAGIRHEHLAAR